MQTWRLMGDEDQCQLNLVWSSFSTTSGLDVKDAIIQDVQELSQVNNQLLKQRGAVGEPADRLHEVGKNMISICGFQAQDSATVGRGPCSDCEFPDETVESDGELNGGSNST